MDGTSREARLNAAFVAVADTLTDHYDVVELLHTLVVECTAIVAATAGGLMLADPLGELQLVASTDESVSVPDIATSTAEWPAFRSAAREQGFQSVHATPMKLRGEVIGTINLFKVAPGALGQRDAAVVQALADVATIGVIQQRISAESQIVADQLQRALESRVLIEQAKGAVSQATGLSMDEAFGALRHYARDGNLTLHAVATAVVDRSISAEFLAELTRIRRPRN